MYIDSENRRIVSDGDHKVFDTDYDCVMYELNRSIDTIKNSKCVVYDKNNNRIDLNAFTRFYDTHYPERDKDFLYGGEINELPGFEEFVDEFHNNVDHIFCFNGITDEVIDALTDLWVTLDEHSILKFNYTDKPIILQRINLDEIDNFGDVDLPLDLWISKNREDDIDQWFKFLEEKDVI